jgi:hypothetical protein
MNSATTAGECGDRTTTSAFARRSVSLDRVSRGPYTRNFMRATLIAAAIGIAVAASAFADTARSGSAKERRYFSARHGVGIEAPPGWTLSQHTGYPTVLVALVHPGGSRISLAVDQTTVKDAGALVDQSKPGLIAQGLTVERVTPGPHSGVQLEARAARRNQALRQLYIVRKIEGGPDTRQAVVVTLATPAADLAAASGPFEWVLAHLTFEAPIRLDAKPETKQPDAGR